MNTEPSNITQNLLNLQDDNSRQSINSTTSSISFHRPTKHDETPQIELFGLFEFIEDRFGARTIVMYVFLAPLCLVINALSFQILTVKNGMPYSQAIFLRALIFVAGVVFLNTKKNTIEISFGTDRMNVLFCAFTGALCNFVFMMSLQFIPICSSFAAILLMKFLSTIANKGFKLQYEAAEKTTFALAILGYFALLAPWERKELVGGCLGIFALVLSFMYELKYSAIRSKVTVLQVTLISNIFILAISLVLMFGTGVVIPSLTGLLAILVMSVCYLASLLLVQRLSELIDDEILRLIHINQVVFGFFADWMFGINSTGIPDFVGAIIVATAANWGQFGPSLNKLKFLMKSDTKQEELEDDLEHSRHLSVIYMRVDRR